MSKKTFTCTFCENPKSILTPTTCCTGCSKLENLCPGYAKVSFIFDCRNGKIRTQVFCPECKKTHSMTPSSKIDFTSNDPVLNETIRILDEEWRKTHCTEIRIFDYE
jgi:hypothetical protein